MASLDLFEKLTLTEVARWLDLHPFEVARILGHEDQLPARLRFDRDEVDRIRDIAGVETWWDGGARPVTDESTPRALVRSLAHKMREFELLDGRTTRADNLFRGLEADDQVTVRRAVNQLIRDEHVRSVPTPRGLHVRVNDASREVISGIADGTAYPPGLEALWA